MSARLNETKALAGQYVSMNAIKRMERGMSLEEKIRLSTSDVLGKWIMENHSNANFIRDVDADLYNALRRQ